jgi:DNA-binding transcriptional MerR regulator/methylmalonyl-CoA mutase cobalamin-binding subunit
MAKLGFNITAVEREVGLSKDVLRVWERRYGFPTPHRDANGERVYSPEQVDRLRAIKRLIDQGHRPGRLLTATAKDLRALSSPRKTTAPAASEDGLGELIELIELIEQHDPEAYTRAMLQRLARQGLQRFVQDTVAPLATLVGLAWEEGRLQVFEEHLFTELTERVLRQAIATVPAGGRPRILLTSLPQEQHGMGLLMAEATLSLEGARCISLGTQTPVLDIVRAAAAHRADVVALSFSAAFPKRQVPDLLQQLRTALPRRTALWAGGSGMSRIPSQDGVLAMVSLQDAVAALAQWRQDHAPGDGVQEH